MANPVEEEAIIMLNHAICTRQTHANRDAATCADEVGLEKRTSKRNW